MERERYIELERISFNERQMFSQREFQVKDLERERADLQTDIER